MTSLPVAIVAVVACLATSASGLVLRNYSSASHDRFTGFPSAPIPNSNFVHAGVDLCGVGFLTPTAGEAVDRRKQFTLVSPRHFVSARHFLAPIGATIRFVAQDGSFVDRSYVARYNIPNSAGEATDLLLSELSAPINPSSGVRFHPYLNLPTEASYVGEDLIVLGKTVRGGVGRIAAFTDFSSPGSPGPVINSTRTMEFTYSTVFGGNDDAYLEGGDSGSPAFVETGGVAALVCTHTAAASVGVTQTGISAFVPEYIDELNSVMGGLGYHMTEVNPASVALAVSQQLPAGVVRAGYPFTLSVTVQNQATTDNANNLRIAQSLPAGALSGLVPTGGWVQEPGGGAVTVLRSGLDAAAATTASMEITLPDPGSFTSALTLNYDEGAPVASSIPITVIESYLSWSSDLVEAGPSDDPDGDGTANLIEYSSGGDPESGSTSRNPKTEHSASGAKISYVRRTDAAQRGLSYTVESNATLAGGTWGEVGGELVSVSASPLAPGFETVVVEVSVGDDRRFFRLRVDLDE